MNVLRFPRGLAAAAALVLLAGACGSAAEPASLEDLGLAVRADIQQGTNLQLAVPLLDDTIISVASAPSGVQATIDQALDDEALWLSVAVDPDAPIGGYYLGLTVVRDGEEQELNWPFDVVPGNTEVAAATTETTAAEPAESETAADESSPESVRDELVTALLAGDPDAVRALWPAASWEDLGTTILADFVPDPDNGGCEQSSETAAHCSVFEQDMPFALGLTLERAGSGPWAITVVGYDSTN